MTEEAAPRRVLGDDLTEEAAPRRVPGDALTEEAEVRKEKDAEFQRMRARRMKAATAWTQARAWSRLNHSSDPQPTQVQNFSPGELVSIHRNLAKGFGQGKEIVVWHGRRRILAIESDRASGSTT